LTRGLQRLALLLVLARQLGEVRAGRAPRRLQLPGRVTQVHVWVPVADGQSTRGQGHWVVLKPGGEHLLEARDWAGAVIPHGIRPEPEPEPHREERHPEVADTRPGEDEARHNDCRPPVVLRREKPCPRPAEHDQ
jgi:hypothetical protein